MEKKLAKSVMPALIKISVVPLLLLCLVCSAYARNLRELSGTVTNQKNEPLAGVSVTVQGSNKGTVTDAKGMFTLSVNEETVLEISFVGYQKQTVNVGNRSSITVILAEAANDLNDVVVVGYGKQRKSNLTGAVATVGTKDIAKNPAANLSNSLVGRAPGIIAVQRSGEPGNDQSDIFIRGIGTTGDASPLYVVDGIVSSQADFAQLNPAEIETVSILKDAASAAVFGVRGGNGIILVTTKRGAVGKTVFSYNANYGIQQLVRTPQFVNAYEYANLYNEALANQGQAAFYSADDIQKFKDGSDPDGHPNTDWYAAVLKQTAPIWQHNISANGGTDKLRYAMSLSYLDQQGIYTGSAFKRYNFRSNIDANVTATTKLSFDVSGSNGNKYAPAIAARDFFYSLLRNRAVDAVTFSNGYSASPVQGNALANIQPSEGYSNNSDWVARLRIQLEQKLPFIKGLSIKGIAAFNKSFSNGKSWSSPSIQGYNYNPVTLEYTPSGPLGSPSLSQTNTDYKSLTLETHLNYENSFGKHKISGLLLYTQTEDAYSGLGAGRQQFIIRVDELNLGPVNSFLTNFGYSGGSGRRGYVGRANYSYNDKYIFEASFREDASEQFAAGKRWGFFPSFSGGWIISKENFMQHANAIDFLKLRASWGVLGNDRISDQRFLYLTSYNSGGAAVFGNNTVAQTINEGRIANPDVTWETVKKLDIGADATFLKGLISITVDYFKDKRNDILAQRSASVPVISGITLPVENIAQVNNQGFDVLLTHTNKISNAVTYNLSANATYTKNKVVFIDEPVGTNANLARTGRPLNSLFGYRALGIFQSEDEIANAPDQSALGTAPMPGDLRYADISGPDGKADGIIDGNDITYIGKSNIPEIIYGFSGGINVKGIELSFLLQGATHVEQYLSEEAAWPFFNKGNALKENLDAWSPTNTGASQPRVLTEDNPNRLYSSFWLKDVAYLKLRNIELAYSFNPSFLTRFKISNLRVYANANNVFTLSSVKNFDPENGDTRGWAYPQLRIFNFGATIQF